MRTLHAALVSALLAASPARADDKTASGKTAPVKPAHGKPAPAKPAPAKADNETIDSIIEKANRQAPPALSDDAPAPESGKPSEKVAAVPGSKPTAKTPGKPEEPPPPPTDDNDGTAEATRPKALEAVRPTTKPRVAGPYELGDLDCRMLDGAGIERILSKKIIAGEEPDLLCRVLVTQPATVATAVHELTLTVSVGTRATYQQKRNVRVGSVGRRAIVFIVPADRIASEDAAKVTMRAVLSAPAKPPTREIRFTVEPAD